MHANRNQAESLRQLRQLLQRPYPIRKHQRRPLQPSSTNGQAMFEISMVVLIRFRMHNDRKVDPRLVHTFQQVLGCRNFFRRVRSSHVIREPQVVLPGEAVEMRIDARRACRRGIHATTAVGGHYS